VTLAPGPRQMKHQDPRSHARHTPEEKRTLDVLAQYSHELRNSLGTIRNAMHVFGAGAAGNPAQERSRVLIVRQVEQMMRLADDLLDVSRMSHGRLKLHCTRIDLCVVIANAMHAVECAMRQREHRMTRSFPEAPIWVRGDEERLEQVFVNLLLNAAKYTPVGGDIGVNVALEADDAVVVIRDNGTGIPAGILPRVFDLYVQANPSSRHEGLGLGLPLVRALVERHGGTVTAASDGIGRGSEFSVRLPVFAQT
jgi:signal transduction histidine kinase